MWWTEGPRRVFAWTEPTDMRKSFQGLLALVQRLFVDHDPYSGSLLSDGYGAYPAYAEKRAQVEHALCWAHMRRGFVEAEDVEPIRVARALEWIGRLYAIEAEIRAKGHAGAAKQKIRGDQSRQIVAEFFEWLKHELAHGALLPRNPFTGAASYALERRRGLEVFLGDPDVPIDTNHLERTLRPIPMGRKSWLFCWTELGAERVGQVQSLITMCVLHGVDPYTYLVDVLHDAAGRRWSVARARPGPVSATAPEVDRSSSGDAEPASLPSPRSGTPDRRSSCVPPLPGTPGSADTRTEGSGSTARAWRRSPEHLASRRQTRERLSIERPRAAHTLVADGTFKASFPLEVR